jgi:hypothetical protein
VIDFSRNMQAGELSDKNIDSIFDEQSAGE